MNQLGEKEYNLNIFMCIYFVIIELVLQKNILKKKWCNLWKNTSSQKFNFHTDDCFRYNGRFCEHFAKNNLNILKIIDWDVTFRIFDFKNPTLSRKPNSIFESFSKIKCFSQKLLNWF